MNAAMNGLESFTGPPFTRIKIPMGILQRHTDQLHCSGEWTITHYKSLNQCQQQLDPKAVITQIDAQSIEHLDTAGAWLLVQIGQRFPQATWLISSQHQHLLDLVTSFGDTKPKTKPAAPWPWLARVGHAVCTGLQEMHAYLAFIGELSCLAWGWLLQPKRITWQAIWQTVQRTGFDALGIVGLLSFLIGIVLAYQMGAQLQSYGANIYIVNLLGVSILREFGPLMTAIIVAGRSGSAFAASIGTMQINQEIAALKTLGVSPTERLALGKMIGLVIALPLLVIWANFTAILGGLIMAQVQLDINPGAYATQFHASVGLNQLWLGLLKAPAFAIIIASIGCFQGFAVRGGADSVGQQTTRSVVQAIFLIIVADAFFSIIMSALHV